MKKTCTIGSCTIKNHKKFQKQVSSIHQGLQIPRDTSIEPQRRHSLIFIHHFPFHSSSFIFLFPQKMANKSPIFPIVEPQHFSDYGFDPQIHYFQVCIPIPFAGNFTLLISEVKIIFYVYYSRCSTSFNFFVSLLINILNSLMKILLRPAHQQKLQINSYVFNPPLF